MLSPRLYSERPAQRRPSRDGPAAPRHRCPRPAATDCLSPETPSLSLQRPSSGRHPWTGRGGAGKLLASCLTNRRRPTTLAAVWLRDLVTIWLVGTAIVSCTSPSVSGVIANEPICDDFYLHGANQLKGALKQPVKAAIFEDEDEDEPIWARVLLGKRFKTDAASKFVIEDDDEEYIVRWSQCANNFAPKRTDYNDPNPQRGSSYQCGETETYATTPLVIKKRDVGSRVMEWQVPPNPECWVGDGSAPPQASASAAAQPADDERAPTPPASASASASVAAGVGSSPTPSKTQPAAADSGQPALPAPSGASATPAPGVTP